MEKLLFVPNPILRQNAKRIDSVGNKEIEIAKKMQEVIIKAPGVGLAANQIGILKQIVTIFYTDPETKKQIHYNLFNPNIINFSRETVLIEEGCLSIPDQFAEIERPETIILEYLDENNNLIKKEVGGMESRILQHEIDHLSGKLFVDYLSSLKRNIMIKKVKKSIKIKNNE